MNGDNPRRAGLLHRCAKGPLLSGWQAKTAGSPAVNALAWIDLCFALYATGQILARITDHGDCSANQRNINEANDTQPDLNKTLWDLFVPGALQDPWYQGPKRMPRMADTEIVDWRAILQSVRANKRFLQLLVRLPLMLII